MRSSVEIPTFVGPVIRREAVGPSHVYQEVSVIDTSAASAAANAIALDYIVIKNYYVYQVIIQQQQQAQQAQHQSSSGSSSSSYASVLREPAITLMPSPRCHDGAERTVRISVEDDFNDLYVPGKPLRFILIQPSPQWIKYELQSIKLYAKASGASATASSSSSRSASVDLGQSLSAYKLFSDRPRSVSQVFDEDFRYITARMKSSVQLADIVQESEAAKKSSSGGKSKAKDKKVKKTLSITIAKAASDYNLTDQNAVLSDNK